MSGGASDAEAREFAAAFRAFLEWVHSEEAGARDRLAAYPPPGCRHHDEDDDGHEAVGPAGAREAHGDETAAARKPVLRWKPAS